MFFSTSAILPDGLYNPCGQNLLIDVKKNQLATYYYFESDDEHIYVNILYQGLRPNHCYSFYKIPNEYVDFLLTLCINK